MNAQFFLEPSDPMLRELYAYWLAKKGSLIAPPRAAIQPDEITPMLPNIVLIDVVGDPPRFKMRLVGTKVVEAFGQEVTGKFVDEIDQGAVGPAILARARALVAERRADLHVWEYTKNDGRHIKYERLILPLSSDGESVDQLLCAYAVLRAYQSHLPPARKP
jgi:hypothetical protein